MARALTSLGVEKATPGLSRREIADGLMPGLYLVVQPSGVKSWAIRYRLHGRPAKFTLGTYPVLGLADAREQARDRLKAIALGVDPAAERRHKRKQIEESGGNEFKAVAGRFIERYAKANCREATWKEYERCLNTMVIPRWKGRAIDTITSADVIAILDSIVDGGTPIAANRTLAVVRRLFNWAVERHMLEKSPCEKVKAPAAEISRDRILLDDEIRLLWRALDKQGWPFGQFIKLLLLTGQRLREVSNLTRPEVDLEKLLWTLPKERTKNGLAHEVPLAPAAAAILKSLPVVTPPPGVKAPGYFFTTTGKTPVSGFSRAKKQIDSAIAAMCEEEGIDPPSHWTLHDLRRTMASGMARLGIAVAVVEKLLNHTSGTFSGVVGVYHRHTFSDEKRRALEAWAAHIEGLVSGKIRTSNIVSIHVDQGPSPMQDQDDPSFHDNLFFLQYPETFRDIVGLRNLTAKYGMKFVQDLTKTLAAKPPNSRGRPSDGWEKPLMIWFGIEYHRDRGANMKPLSAHQVAHSIAANWKGPPETRLSAKRIYEIYREVEKELNSNPGLRVALAERRLKFFGRKPAPTLPGK